MKAGAGRGTAVAVASVPLIVSVVLVATVFLWPFVSGRATAPFGFDTPHYLWRANLVAAEGLDALEAIPVPELNANAERPAYSVFASLLWTAGGPDPPLLSYVAPAVLAVAIALAAGAFAREVLDEPPWSMALYALVVGSSLMVVRTAVGSIDNMIADSLLLAAAAATILGATRRRGLAAAAFMLVAAGQTHWILTVYVALLLAGVGLVWLPDAARRLRRGEPWWSLPSARIAVTVGASAAVVQAGTYLAPDAAVSGPRIPVASVEEKTLERLPALRLLVTAPMAVLGALCLWWPEARARRMGLAFLAIWVLSLAVALVLYAAGHRLPVYRVAQFCLAIPILVTALAVGVTRLSRTYLRGTGRVAGEAGGAILVGVLAVATVIGGAAAWQSFHGLLKPRTMQAVASAANYLRAVDAEGPVVFVTSLPKFTASDRVIRAGVPPHLIAGTRTFVGDGADLLAGRPTRFEPGDRRIKPAAIAWPGVRQVIDEDYIAVHLSEFNPGSEPPAGSFQVAPGVHVLRGPAPDGPVEGAPLPRPEPGRLIAGAALALLAISIVGIGWSAGLIDATWTGRVGFAPAMGLGSLILIGTVAGRIGVPLRGAGGGLIVATAAAGGWIVVAARWLLARRREADATAS